MITVQLNIPELKVQTTTEVNSLDSIWTAKKEILSSIAQELRDGLNYGIYCPASNGKAGKFFDEERLFKDYPKADLQVIELVYKKRVYKTSNFNPKKLKEFNTKTRHRKVLNFVKIGSSREISRLLSKGLDPNFQDFETGETPLTLATSLKNPRDVMMTLVEGGAHLDYRDRNGMTPMHRAALAGNKMAIQSLLDLGASPNYRDANDLTPLYLCVCNNASDECVELLLKDYAILDVVDEAGWAESHQACKFGRKDHLDLLIHYGANIDSRNLIGNTPLHVAVLNHQMECVVMLLRRGADKSISNDSNQEAYYLAVLSNNQELADVISSYEAPDTPPSREIPMYNEKRRATVRRPDTRLSTLKQQKQFSTSTPHLHLLCQQADQMPHGGGRPNLLTKSLDGRLAIQTERGGFSSMRNLNARGEDSDSSDSDRDSRPTINYGSDTDATYYEEILRRNDRSSPDPRMAEETGLDALIQLDQALNGLDISQMSDQDVRCQDDRSQDNQNQDDRCQDARSPSPYSTLSSADLNRNKDLKIASIRSYPKRLVASVFQENLFTHPGHPGNRVMNASLDEQNLPSIVLTPPPSKSTNTPGLNPIKRLQANDRVNSFPDLVSASRRDADTTGKPEVKSVERRQPRELPSGFATLGKPVKMRPSISTGDLSRVRHLTSFEPEIISLDMRRARGVSSDVSRDWATIGHPVKLRPSISTGNLSSNSRPLTTFFESSQPSLRTFNSNENLSTIPSKSGPEAPRKNRDKEKTKSMEDSLLSVQMKNRSMYGSTGALNNRLMIHDFGSNTLHDPVSMKGSHSATTSPTLRRRPTPPIRSSAVLCSIDNPDKNRVEPMPVLPRDGNDSSSCIGTDNRVFKSTVPTSVASVREVDTRQANRDVDFLNEAKQVLAKFKTDGPNTIRRKREEPDIDINKSVVSVVSSSHLTTGSVSSLPSPPPLPPQANVWEPEPDYDDLLPPPPPPPPPPPMSPSSSALRGNNEAAISVAALEFRSEPKLAPIAKPIRKSIPMSQSTPKSEPISQPTPKSEPKQTGPLDLSQILAQRNRLRQQKQKDASETEQVIPPSDIIGKDTAVTYNTDRILNGNKSNLTNTGFKMADTGSNMAELISNRKSQLRKINNIDISSLEIENDGEEGLPSPPPCFK